MLAPKSSGSLRVLGAAAAATRRAAGLPRRTSGQLGLPVRQRLQLRRISGRTRSNSTLLLLLPSRTAGQTRGQTWSYCYCCATNSPAAPYFWSNLASQSARVFSCATFLVKHGSNLTLLLLLLLSRTAGQTCGQTWRYCYCCAASKPAAPYFWSNLASQSARVFSCASVAPARSSLQSSGVTFMKASALAHSLPANTA